MESPPHSRYLVRPFRFQELQSPAQLVFDCGSNGEGWCPGLSVSAAPHQRTY